MHSADNASAPPYETDCDERGKALLLSVVMAILLSCCVVSSVIRRTKPAQQRHAPGIDCAPSHTIQAGAKSRGEACTLIGRPTSSASHLEVRIPC